MNPHGIRPPIPAAMRRDIAAWTEDNAAARDEYRAHPIASCRRTACDELRIDGDVLCTKHAADRERHREGATR